MQNLIKAMMCFVVLACAGTTTAWAQADAAPGPAYLVTYIEVLPRTSGKALGLLRSVRAASRKAAGVTRYDVYQRRERPNHFAIIEAWQDAAARDANLAAPHTKKFRDELQPLLAAGYDERPHAALDVGPATTAAIQGTAIITVTHVDFIPPRKDEGIAALRAIVEPSRKEPGNFRYDILQQSSRPNHLTLVEAWRDLKALEAHESAAHTVKFRDLSTPMSGALFDQRLYRAVE